MQINRRNAIKLFSFMGISLCVPFSFSRLFKPNDYLSTGWPRLDGILGGLKPGELIVLGGRPSMGKTSFALNLAKNVAKPGGKKVAVFSYELLASEVSKRLLNLEAGFPTKEKLKGGHSTKSLKSVSKAVVKLSEAPIYINDSGSITTKGILDCCNDLKDVGLVIVDYLQLVPPSSRDIPVEDQVFEISRELRSISKKLNCSIVALSQLNRSVEDREDKRPNEADLRYSSHCDSIADVIAFIYRDECYNGDTKEKGIAEIIVTKNRKGDTGTVKLRWLGSIQKFKNLS